MRVAAAGVTHAGNVRRINEDAWLSSPELGLYIVADGMGGHNAGEVASRIAVETIERFIRRTAESDDVTWPYGIDAAQSFDANRLRTAIQLANRRVFKMAEERDDFAGMGTTVVALLVGDGQIVYSSVGDSRLYAWSNGALEQLTTDDSWAATVAHMRPMDSGAHPMRHVLTNAVGVREQVDFAVNDGTVRAGERLLLCTDGVHGELSHGTLGELIALDRGPDGIAAEILARVLATSARDNATALVACFDPE